MPSEQGPHGNQREAKLLKRLSDSFAKLEDREACIAFAKTVSDSLGSFASVELRASAKFMAAHALYIAGPDVYQTAFEFAEAAWQDAKDAAGNALVSINPLLGPLRADLSWKCERPNSIEDLLRTLSYHQAALAIADDTFPRSEFAGLHHNTGLLIMRVYEVGALDHQSLFDAKKHFEIALEVYEQAGLHPKAHEALVNTTSCALGILEYVALTPEVRKEIFDKAFQRAERALVELGEYDSIKTAKLSLVTARLLVNRQIPPVPEDVTYAFNLLNRAFQPVDAIGHPFAVNIALQILRFGPAVPDALASRPCTLY